MKLEEVAKAVEKPGTYVGLHFDPKTTKSLAKFCLVNKIPNTVPEEKMHVTLLYSKKHLPDYNAPGDLKTPFTAKPKDFTVWETNGENKEKSRCLVLRLLSPELVDHHKELMKKHEATYDYPVYEPHVTLSYNIGDMDVDDFDIEDLPKKLVMPEEYAEELATDWASKL